MAKTLIAGDAIIFTSELKLEDIAKLEKHDPKALTLENKDKEVYFKVGTGMCGSINKYGATFSGEARDGSGKATITVMIGDGFSEDELKEVIADHYGAGLANLAKIEASAPKAIEEVDKAREKIISAIEVA